MNLTIGFSIAYTCNRLSTILMTSHEQASPHSQHMVDTRVSFFARFHEKLWHSNRAMGFRRSLVDSAINDGKILGGITQMDLGWRLTGSLAILRCTTNKGKTIQRAAQPTAFTLPHHTLYHQARLALSYYKLSIFKTMTHYFIS